MNLEWHHYLLIAWGLSLPFLRETKFWKQRDEAVKETKSNWKEATYKMLTWTIFIALTISLISVLLWQMLVA